VNSVLQDIRYALRLHRRQVVLSSVIVLTLGMGIGANTAIFGFVYALLIRPFPYPDAERLVRIQTASLRGDRSTVEMSLPDLEDYRTAVRGFSGMALYQSRTMDLLADGRAYSIQVALVSQGLFSTMDVSPMMGRVFLDEETRPGGDVFKAVLSYNLWRNRYGSDPQIVGKQVRTAIASYAVVGVMPPGFEYPGQTGMWIPIQSYLAVSSADWIKTRGTRTYAAIGRLRSGISLKQADAELQSISAQLQKTYPNTNADFRPVVRSLRDAEVGDIRPYALVVWLATILILAICCSNIGNLLLASAAQRARESVLRLAIGASRTRLLRQFLIESVVLAAMGGVLGLIVAWLAIRAIPALLPADLPAWLRVDMDIRVLFFNLVVTLGTGIAFGLVPGFHVLRMNLNDVLKEGSRASARGGWLRSALVISEMALSCALVASAALLAQSFRNLRQVDPGFQSQNVLTFQLSPYRPGKGDESVVRYADFYRRVIGRLQQMPGVVAAGATNNLPFTHASVQRNQATIGIRSDTEDQRRMRGNTMIADATAGYFEAMGIPFHAGRLFTEADTKDRPQAIVVSERTAERLFPGRSALGQQIRLEYLSGSTDPWGTVVGIVGNVKHAAAEDAAGLELYYPNTQYPVSTARVVVRVAGDPRAMQSAVTRTVAEVAPDTAMSEMKTMTELMQQTLWQQRLWSLVLIAFASLALILAGVGLYGVMNYTVRQRTREIGIRVALGAQPAQIAAWVTTKGLLLTSGGLVAGLALAVALGRWMQNLLFGIRGSDVATLVAVPAVLGLSALVACAFPAGRAAAVDPLIAIRDE
jgi:putative ABC transport system permease protein